MERDSNLPNPAVIGDARIGVLPRDVANNCSDTSRNDDEDEDACIAETGGIEKKRGGQLRRQCRVMVRKVPGEMRNTFIIWDSEVVSWVKQLQMCGLASE